MSKSVQCGLASRVAFRGCGVNPHISGVFKASLESLRVVLTKLLFRPWRNKFTTGTDWGTGDFNGDGTTGVRDSV